MNNTKSQLQFF